MPQTKSTDLAELAKRANDLYGLGQAAEKKSLAYYRQAGEALIEAKKKVGHGKWETWMKNNLKFSPTQAKRYMALVKSPVTVDSENEKQEWQKIQNGSKPKKGSAKKLNGEAKEEATEQSTERDIYFRVSLKQAEQIETWRDRQPDLAEKEARVVFESLRALYEGGNHELAA
jgi:hypothetical protein